MVDEVPGSTTLWEVTPRPSNSSDVSTIELDIYPIIKQLFIMNEFLCAHSYLNV